ncbi:hypothetical protein PSH85_25015 [Pseudomonas simiae]|nr:hypothetical protein [Pseudomonas simiae]WLG33551.1 hypothetical protein PSH82_24980 [Pseudomonas simiae]WLI23524.1 hypothetical protein PSH85_25015 [Pseudomonas simiae]
MSGEGYPLASASRRQPTLLTMLKMAVSRRNPVLKSLPIYPPEKLIAIQV